MNYSGCNVGNGVTFTQSTRIHTMSDTIGENVFAFFLFLLLFCSVLDFVSLTLGGSNIIFFPFFWRFVYFFSMMQSCVEDDAK